VARHRTPARLLAKPVKLLARPVRMVTVAFGSAVVVGTVLLWLPLAHEGGEHTDLDTALFTAASAVCVTGHIIVDTPTHWSLFGELVILCLIQIGGFGVMTLATLLSLVAARRLGLKARLWAQTETKSLGAGDIARVVRRVVKFSLLLEVAASVLFGGRLALGYDEPLGHAAYVGVFHGVSAFNNAGFSLYSDSLERFVGDPWITLTVAGAVIIGGIGFPVLLELRRELRRPRDWSLHTQITLGVTGALLVVGTVGFTAAEWANPGTLGPLNSGDSILAGFFHSVMPRTAGFNSVPTGELYPGTLLGLDVLMFIGGGSAGTAGGIKVTTFALLGFVIWAELRGEPHVNVFRRRLPEGIQRQALTVALLSVGLVVVSTMALLALTDHRLDDVLFEVVSAFGTVGLSTGITSELPAAGHIILTVLMFIGRLGPITLGSALALREQTRHYELPEERPIVG
jgi:trk system potassium uptake protein TrkH